MFQMVAEYSTSNLTTGGGTSYLTMDTLGTPRIISGTNINDSTGGVKARHDYLPFGEEITLTGGRTEAQGYVVDSIKQKFSQKERDVETGLDYFQARYYASAQGRFTSVDPISVTSKQMVNPQRWNKYTYVINNPLALYDPVVLQKNISRRVESRRSSPLGGDHEEALNELRLPRCVSAA